MAGTVQHGSLVQQFASMKPTEFGPAIEPKWQLGGRLIKQVQTAVEKQELQPLDGPRFLRAEGSISAIDMQPLWWPSTKIVGRYLSPFLAEHLGLATTIAEPPNEAVPVEVALDTRDHASWSAV